MADPDLVLFGPPGAGKGTQAKPLAAERRLAYVATGDLLRAAVSAGTEAGRSAKRHIDAGELVPDALVLGLGRRRSTRNSNGSGGRSRPRC